jgi:uncharacterized cupredoxin-like copper-binding protein
MQNRNIVAFSLAIFTSLLSGNALAQSPTPVEISLTNYAFTPNNLELKQGVTYRFHLHNTGSKRHSFSAPELFAASKIADEDGKNVEKGNIELDDGQAIDLTITPVRAGIYSVTCTHFMHDMMGMHGKIVVQ